MRLAPPPPTRRPGQPNGRPRRSAVAVAVFLLLGVGLAAFAISQSSHSGGDPAERFFTPSRRSRGLFHRAATITYTIKNDAVWSPACPDNPSGRAGWSGVEVLTNFKAAGTTQAIVSAVGASLATQGWTPTLATDDAAWQDMPIAEWTKSVPGTTSAKVVIFKYPQSAGLSPGGTESAWMLGAEGKTPGYALPGC